MLDTSVLIAALRSNHGAAAEVLRLVLGQEVTLLLDYKLVCEYRDVAFRPEHLAVTGRTQNEVEEVVSALESVAEGVLVLTRLRPLSPDPDDDMVVDVAINGHADILLTQNIKDLQVAERFGIRTLTPGDFLEPGETRNANR